ncbi:MAG: hypothetical protein CMG63_00465 [Candidatus Marinimicrobia bacterium]|nr:hypothetical protein [Candidatus Neomarinimicrobiota bacterium]
MKLFSLLIFVHSFSVSLDLRDVNRLKNWNLLQDNSVKIESRIYKGFPISKAETILEHNIEQIANIIKDLDNYPNIFERVTNTRHIGENIVHIILDMPFPFDGRDYIVEYEIIKKIDSWVFTFSALENERNLKIDGHVRLPNAAGVWILDKTSENSTKVTYAWNGELLGNFPDFGLERAWITQGSEVLGWLDQALSNK